MTQIGRNARCPCGSGKKHKHCCLNRMGDAEFDNELEDAMQQTLAFNPETIAQGVSRLEALRDRADLPKGPRRQIVLALAQSYQNQGRHRLAISTLRSVADPAQEPELGWIEAVSLCALGQPAAACALFEASLGAIPKAGDDRRLRATVLAEAGCAYKEAGDESRARNYWEEAVRLFGDAPEDREHVARVQANLGSLLLWSSDQATRERGIRIIETSSEFKAKVGDLEGLANNYCNLALLYWRERRFERALAYMRTDLNYSRKAGDQQAVATTLVNLAALYADLKQLAPARKCLSEAQQIGETLGDSRCLEKVAACLKHVSDVGREAGLRGETFGPNALCECGSGQSFGACCGRADAEPPVTDFQYSMLPELDQLREEMTAAGIAPSRLDVILRSSPQTKERLAWMRSIPHDGWREIRELPDVTNMHLQTARTLAGEALDRADAYGKPLASMILSVCAIEAFINQVAFFVDEVQRLPDAQKHPLPPELADGLKQFLFASLLDKWAMLGRALCGAHWPPPSQIWSNTRFMVEIRNELVHFKSLEYEQVIPRLPKHPVLDRAPAGVEVRDVERAWPVRLLTPSFAKFCADTAEQLIDHFKNGYRNTRVGPTAMPNGTKS